MYGSMSGELETPLAKADRKRFLHFSGTDKSCTLQNYDENVHCYIGTWVLLSMLIIFYIICWSIHQWNINRKAAQYKCFITQWDLCLGIHACRSVQALSLSLLSCGPLSTTDLWWEVNSWSDSHGLSSVFLSVSSPSQPLWEGWLTQGRPPEQLISTGHLHH